MKDDKIVIGQLKSLLAKKAKISERQAAQFVEALFQQISVGLQQDGQVKISGLGTFKIQWNEPRKSVDVNTGNEIVIDGYNKVTFSPEASIKTLVNMETIMITSALAAMLLAGFVFSIWMPRHDNIDVR